VRVVLFVILVLAVLAAGYVFVRWYANDNWYVTLDGNNLAIYRGRPGGLLWFQPKLVERSSVTTATIEPYRVATVKSDVDEPTLAAAKEYVANLHQEYVSHQQLRNGTPVTPQATAPTTGSTTAPGGR
jgi:protein phosphatase